MGVGVVITRFKAKSQFKLDFTATELELSLATEGLYKVLSLINESQVNEQRT